MESGMEYCLTQRLHDLPSLFPLLFMSKIIYISIDVLTGVNLGMVCIDMGYLSYRCIVCTNL